MTSAARDLTALLSDTLATLAPDARSLAVAVSGGGDSVALASLARDAGFSVTVLHVDHALRPTSAADAAFVAALASGWGLPQRQARVDVARIARTGNVSAVARTLRYATLARLSKAAGADVLLVAHTRDDQAETVLLQALRGAAYLRGMPARQGRVVRPLLAVGREELRSYLRARAIAWRDDPGNLDPARARGWLRTAVLPALEARYPGATERLARLAALQGDVADALAGAAARLPRGATGVDARALVRAPRAVAREALAALLREAGVAVDGERIEDARAHLRDRVWRRTLAPGRAWRVLAGEVSVARNSLAPPERQVADPRDLPAGVDPAILALGPLTLRAPRSGDRVVVGGRPRPLAEALARAGIPREARPAVRVLARGADVPWVEGVLDFGPEGTRRVVDEDRRFMREALALARSAGAAGELPVGAVVVLEGEIVGAGANATRATCDPTAHAEVLAIRAAARELGDWRLRGATLVVTLEPCPMCLGALLAAHVDRVVYGATNEREGALGGVANVAAEAWKRRVRVRSGVLARAAGRLLTDFFAHARDRDAGSEGARLYDERDEDPQLLDHRPRRSR